MTRRSVRTIGLRIAVAFAVWTFPPHLRAQATAALVDLKGAVVVVPEGLSNQEQLAVRMLIEEVETRSRIRWPRAEGKTQDAKAPRILVGPRRLAERFLSTDPSETPERVLGPEGFSLRVVVAENAPVKVIVLGEDARGVLFGVGRLLRELRLAPESIRLRPDLAIQTQPAVRIRGHQLGYRPKTNSYDGWDLKQWEQYVRDLAVFGANAVELIPPRSDDEDESPHFPLPKIEMMAGMSKLLDDYGLDAWIWYPAIDGDYSDPKVVEESLASWASVLRRLPRVDAIFVPSGDPGSAPPPLLLALLERQTRQLKEIHPNATMWISVQSFTSQRFDGLMETLRRDRPKWLAGIVYGPQTRVTPTRLRELLPEQYPIRRYPDITHSMRCEYPVPDWDVAYAITEAREPINPRPLDQAAIFRAYNDSAAGFITYSEGCNDDVNKAIWSGLGWDPQADVVDLLREYSRYFIGADVADDFAQGLLALERNWRGPLRNNDGVATTLQQFRALEKRATPRQLLNWRFQQALYRAYYDAYLRQKLIEEAALEERAMEALRMARRIGPQRAIKEAAAILAERDTHPAAADRRARVFELAEALFQSIRMQLSVERYRAIAVGRGANLDTIDLPLNNRLWLEKRFGELLAVDDDAARLRGIHEILHWTDPGPGGFYDDLGDPDRQPHLVRPKSYEQDPGFLESPTVGFRYDPQWRRSWWTHVDGLYETPITLRYPNVDPDAAYKVRVVYAGDNFHAQVRLEATGGVEVHPFRPKPSPVRPIEFDLPREATRTGTLELTWRATPGRGGPGRGCQIAEVWLLKRDR